MSDPRRHGPTRGELWVWLGIAGAGLAMMVATVVLRWQSGLALAEVVVLPGLLFGWLGARSVRRLIRRDHPE